MEKMSMLDDKTLFNEVFANLSARYKNLTMRNSLVYYNGECKFNTDGYNLGYNLLRLTQVLEEAGEFR